MFLYQFQSTLPQGERRDWLNCPNVSVHFNPRSHKGSDVSNYAVAVFYRYFNPRSHKGSDDVTPIPNGALTAISIHAPTRGATSNSSGGGGRPKISIHAPTRGATCVDHSGQWVLDISIHAPTRGATVLCVLYNPYCGIFQSTLPQGERLKSLMPQLQVTDFNPRSHKGSDFITRG